jgi:hypothetical protein
VTVDFLAKTGALLIQLSKLLAEIIFSTLPAIPNRPIDWIIYLPTSAGILVGSKVQVIGKWIIQVEKHGKEGGRNLPLFPDFSSSLPALMHEFLSFPWCSKTPINMRQALSSILPYDKSKFHTKQSSLSFVHYLA